MKKTALFLLGLILVAGLASCTKQCNCVIDNGTDTYSYTISHNGQCSELNQTQTAKANNSQTETSSTRRTCTNL